MAKERRAGSLGYSETMLIYYNNKMKNPLPWNTLYSNKIKAGSAKTTDKQPEEDELEKEQVVEFQEERVAI